MLLPTVPDDEAARLAALDQCSVLGSHEEAFDDLARLAAELCNAPIALISFVESERQWFKARVGLEAEQTPRKIALCSHAILMDEPLIVPDLRNDARFADNPLVTADPCFRFYAGVPLRVQDGSAIGTLCVLDRVPRQLEASQLAALRTLAGHVVRELRSRRERAIMHAGTSGELPVGPGDRLGGQWWIERELGRGGIGAVFAGRSDNGTRVAIKVLLPQWVRDERVFERFAREAQILRLLRSPHSARLLDVGNLQPSRAGLPYLVLEHLEGKDLATTLREHGPFEWRRAASWIADAAEGVAEAHAAGVIHRDLKPANIFITDARAGEASVVKVLDFGIAKWERSPTHAPLTQVGELMGSLGYMSPEQMKSVSDADTRSDVWSLGVVLYELLTGRMPFEGASMLQLCMAVATHAPLPLGDDASDAPPALRALVMQCLRKDPAARPADAAQLMVALRQLLATHGSQQPS